MRIVYDRETDTLTIVFASTPIFESDEDKPGIILDYDADGRLVSLEILDAAKQSRLIGTYIGLPIVATFGWRLWDSSLSLRMTSLGLSFGQKLSFDYTVRR